MNNDKYINAKKKAREMRVKKRTEWINTDWSEKIKNSDVNVSLKSMMELAKEIEELTGRSK
jgi:hypothetical protein